MDLNNVIDPQGNVPNNMRIFNEGFAFRAPIS